jgi:arsenate reductase
MGRDVECSSAGSKPASRVQPDTITVMGEVGIDLSNARPKGFADLPDLEFDYVVTMGCEVDCPFIPGAKVVQWEIPDPYGKGVEEYRRVRNLIRSEVTALLARLGHLPPDQPDNHQPLA